MLLLACNEEYYYFSTILFRNILLRNIFCEQNGRQNIVQSCLYCEGQIFSCVLHNPKYMILLRLLFLINPTSYPSRDFFLTLSNRFRSLTSGVYTLRNNVTQEEYQVYCHMEEISGCGEGGWTLVMKVDGKEVNAMQFRVYGKCG